MTKPRLYLHPIEDFRQCLRLNPLCEFFLGDGAVQAVIQRRTRCSIDNVPHLRFSRLALCAHGIGIIRVHLNGEILLGINELNQNRHGGTAVTVSPQKRRAVGIQIFPQSPSGIRAAL